MRLALTPRCDWNLRVDLKRQLKFLTKITTTSLRPDVILWSTTARTVIMAEVTVPWEAGMEVAFKRKKDKYTGLAAECKETGWPAIIYPVKVGYWGFMGTSTQCFLMSEGVTGPKLKKAHRDLTKEEEQGSFWPWLRRKDQRWAKQGS